MMSMYAQHLRAILRALYSLLFRVFVYIDATMAAVRQLLNYS